MKTFIRNIVVSFCFLYGDISIASADGIETVLQRKLRHMMSAKRELVNTHKR